MILNDLPGIISKPGELKRRKRSGEDCGNEWVSIPKFCGKLVGTGWIKVKQEYQQQLCSCVRKTRHYFRCNKDVPYFYGCCAEHLLSVT